MNKKNTAMQMEAGIRPQLISIIYLPWDKMTVHV